jgi:hypothetical protein
MGTLAIALELLLLHTLVWAKQLLEARVQTETRVLYSELVRAAVDYAEEWARNVRTSRTTPRQIDGTAKLNQAVEYVTMRQGGRAPFLEKDIHAELGRRRALSAIAVPNKPPPLPPRTA